MPTLAELTASTKRLAIVGLAKNTGKTVTLNTLLRELEAQGQRVGVTSVGRDGEERDAIDARIEKPRVHLPPGSLVATTDSLLRASSLAHELLEDTDVRTPLGRVLIACLRAASTIEVAGPSAGADVRAVTDAMLAHGAERVLIDGAVDRRVASCPEVSDGLVMTTGAVLSRDLEDVVAQTRAAVELVLLPSPGEDFEQAADGESLTLPPRFALTAEADEVEALLDEHSRVRYFSLVGALPERFMASLLRALSRSRRTLTLVVADPTKVFLSARSPDWYARQGIHLRSLRRIDLRALTVNPVAPRSHRFEWAELHERFAATLPPVPTFDVLDPSYSAAALLR